MGSKLLLAQSRTEALKESLSKLCQELGPGSKLPTVRAISTNLGASTSTLDRVMGELEREGRIVRRHGSGVFVADSKKASTIALVSGVDPFAVGQSPFYQIVSKLIRQGVAASGRGFKFYLDPHFENHGMASRSEFLADLSDGKLLGAVFIATAHPEIFLKMNEINFPYVAMADCPDALRRFHVDSPSIVSLGVDELAKAGRKRLCLLTWDGFGSQVEDCHGEFKRSLERNGLPLLEGSIWTRKVKTPFDDVESRTVFGAIAAREMLAGPGAAFDGLVCTDDMLCAGALAFLRERSLSPGGSLLVATHANKGSPSLSFAERGVIKLQVDTGALVADVLESIEGLASGRAIAPFCKIAKLEIVRCALA